MKVAMSPEVLRRHSQFHTALTASLINSASLLLARFLYIGEVESIISSF